MLFCILLAFFLCFSPKICVFIIFIPFFDKVSNFCNRILTNQKRESVVSNCQRNCMEMKIITQLTMEKQGCHGHQYLLFMIVMIVNDWRTNNFKWKRKKFIAGFNIWKNASNTHSKFSEGLFCNHHSLFSVLLVWGRRGASSRAFPTLGQGGRIHPVAKNLLISSHQHHH